MYIRDGIAYAGAEAPAIRVNGVRALDNYKLWVRFTTGEEKTFDFAPLLETPCYAPLKDEVVFKGVYIDFGYPVWMDGEIDIDAETLYSGGVCCGGKNA